MKHTLTFALLVLLIFSLGCQSGPSQSGSASDSSLLDQALAQEAASTRKRMATNDAITGDRQNAITRAVARVSPAVVGITVLQVQRFVQRSPFGDDPLFQFLFPELRDRVIEKPVESLGSGFLITADGYLLTNEHVVENAEKVVVTMTNGSHHNATVVGTDRVTDIALLKIEGDHLPYIPMGNSDDILVGEWVIALGNPFGLFNINDKPTVTVGVVSSVDVDWGRDSQSGRLYLDMIQTDAAINRGNSGGPLVNALGEVIGMNTFIFTGSPYEQGWAGIGFAIPVNRIKEIVKEIRTHGSINRDYWLGIVKVQDLNPQIIRALGLPVDHGVIITQIERSSPAYRAGLREGDLIVALNQKPVTDVDQFVDLLTNMDLRVGDVLNFTVYRENRQLDIPVRLEGLRR